MPFIYPFDLRSSDHVVVFGWGVLLASLMLARGFGRFHGGNSPEATRCRLTEAALNQLRADGFEVRDEDVARLSLLLYEHINMLGWHSFSVPDAVAKGERRPLRNPANDE
jgi:hypothetical protein